MIEIANSIQEFTTLELICVGTVDMFYGDRFSSPHGFTPQLVVNKTQAFAKASARDELFVESALAEGKFGFTHSDNQDVSNLEWAFATTGEREVMSIGIADMWIL
eukprot:gnl/MRDRNA2_/MRDRNA2_47976_c0_seq1.p1 gnl/MRDRNA2_/MRDRNA2_47976_c0~~gnl/MRDRNA2_/MRDRNA2_47976_c0_seq1.p1  ORF type:complete len:105 (+),score=15.27 gnl/MRDRNA2_/MRDRNA2_47976_c0_seq1:30-344(+)